MHAALFAAGIDGCLQMIDGMHHVAVTRGKDLPGSAETFAAVAAFIDSIVHLDGEGAPA